MADEKKTVRENAEGKKTNKFVAFFKNLPQNIATPFKNMWHELKKVTWPTRQDLIKYACIVLLFMVFMGVVIGLLKSADETVISDDAAGLVNEAEDAAQELVSEVEEGAEGTVPATEETAEGAGQKAAPEETQAPADGK